jgi:long-chain fatty acid transport protein
MAGIKEISMSRTRRALAVLAMGVLLALPLSEVQAGGFSIYEQGARAMGRASAFVAMPNDPSAIFYNPAGLALLDGTQIYVGATFISPSADFSGTDPFGTGAVTGTQASNLFFPPNVYISHRLNEKVVLGFGVHTPFGLGTEWEDADTFAGRHLSTNAEIQGVAFNPTVAYSVNDQLALGVGVDIRYSRVILDRYVFYRDPSTGLPANPLGGAIPLDIAQASLTSDYSTGVGFDFGLLYRANDQVTFGFSYRHFVQIKYEGTAEFDQILTGVAIFDNNPALLAALADQDVKTQINYPWLYNFGIAYQATDDLLAEFDVNYWGWSVFNELRVTGLLTGPEVSDEDYEDAFEFRAGLEWQKSAELALRAGFVYDMSPAPPKAISPLLPDADRMGITAGLGYDFGAARVDAAFMYLIFSDADTKGEHPVLNGVYENSALLFGLDVGVPIGR